jgi:hypothetical protein
MKLSGHGFWLNGRFLFPLWAEAVWKRVMPLSTQCVSGYVSGFSVIKPSEGT